MFRTIPSSVRNAKAFTDEYGFFYLKSTEENMHLTASHIGYKPSTILIEDSTKNRSSIQIELQPDIINLKDIVLQSNTVAKFNTISKIDLGLKPVRNTQELLSLVPGLFIAQHAGGGKAEQIFLRGFDVDHGTDVRVSVDGLPVNMLSHAHGQGYADAHFIIPETINNIDFGAGPYYAQQGNLNTAGYVSFSTFNSIPKSSIQIEGGRFNSFRSLVMIDLLKKNKDKQSAYVAADFNYTDGPTISKQKFNRFNFFTKYNLAITEKTSMTALLSAFKSRWDASGQVPQRAIESGLISRFGSIDPTEGGNTERYNASISLTHRYANGTNWETQVFYSRYIFNLFSNFTFFLNDPLNGDEIQQAESRDIFGLTSKINQKYFFGNTQLSATYGTGIRYDHTADSKLSNVVKRQFLSNIKLGNIKEANAYAFTQQQLSVGKWLFDAGVRFDYFHFDYLDKLNMLQLPAREKSIVSPKLNVQYTLNERIQFFAKAGKGFHSNDARVVTANEGKEILPAAYGSDIGIMLKPNKNLFFSVACWNLFLAQEFVYVGDAGIIEPSGKTRREGIDIVARYQFTKHLFANANINFTKPRAIGELKGEDFIPLAPTFTSIGGIFYKQPLGFNGGLNYRYIKNRPANEDNSIIAKGYFLLDGSINYTKKKYEIGISAENIFNIKWNEAQFATESRLQNENEPVTELHFTPGTPFFARVKFAVFF